MISQAEILAALDGDDAQTVTDPAAATSLGQVFAIAAARQIHAEHGVELGLSLAACVRLVERRMESPLDGAVLEVREEPDHPEGMGATLRVRKAPRKRPALAEAGHGELATRRRRRAG